MENTSKSVIPTHRQLLNQS